MKTLSNLLDLVDAPTTHTIDDLFDLASAPKKTKPQQKISISAVERNYKNNTAARAKLRALYNKFAYAQYVVANGGQRTDILSKEEINILLDKFLHYLIASKHVEPYQPK